MSHPARRFSLLALALLLVGTFLGGLVGGGAQADVEIPDDGIRTFSRVLSMVEDQFIGEPDSKDLVEDAITGLLQTLDPHSNYLSPESFSEMRDEQRGKFSGLGIQITKRGPDKPLTIISPIDGTPAYRAGLQSGDIISHIEGEPTIELTVHEAVRRLKGDKGTRVLITIERPGMADPFDVTIERDDIPIESIRVAYMLTDDVGLVRLSNFTSTTADELDRSIERLQEAGMTRLLIDLRGNPGGLLDQAVQVTERFLDPGKLVVYTRGRVPGSSQDYLAKRGVDRTDLPLILLVNRSSASASEIFSGAVQDHDRGLVVGETTFGKGLVQRVIPLKQGGALAVTTAKYYTPSGRLIQRDYSDLDEYYLMGRNDEAEPPAAPESESDQPTDNVEVFYTASGREVYGGGGIRPDYIVKTDDVPSLVIELLRENLVFDWSVLHTNKHPHIERTFAVTPQMLGEFRAFLDEREYEYEPAEFDQQSEMIQLRIKAQIARIRWDQQEESRILASADPQVQRALELFEEAADLAKRGTGGKPGRQNPLALRAEATTPAESEDR